MPVLLAVRRGAAEAELLDDRPVRERLDEHARRELLVVGDIAIAAAAIGDAVEHADLIRERAVGDVAERLHAEIAVRRELRRQAALGERRRASRPAAARARTAP